MKWSRWIVFSLASLASLAVVAANAAEPKLNSPRLSKVPVAATRYAVYQADAAPPAAAAPAAAAPRGGITPHAPVHYRSATWDIWSGTATGYVYSPGACDYTPPCVNGLWDGYVQRPHRCNPIHVHQWCNHGCGHCGNGGACGGFGGCDSCGSASSCGCGRHASFLKRAHGWHFGNRVCGSGCSSCGDIAPSCGYDGGKSVDPAPAPAPSDAVAPPAPMPTAEGEASDYEVPARSYESASPKEAARGNRLRGFTWPENSLQR